MKKIALVAGMVFAGMAFAEYPELTVDGHIVIEQDHHVIVERLDVGPADILNSQYNHESAQTNEVHVMNNRTIEADVDVDTTTVGNNLSIDLSGDHTVQNVQGNQVGGQYSHIDIQGNRIQGEVLVDTTTIGNNASMTADSLSVDNTQFNHDSDMVSEVIVHNNRFGDVPLDPSVDLTLVGNNLSLTAGSVGLVSSHQQNVNSDATASVDITRNRGAIGPVNVGSTVIGNNVSIGQ